MMTSSNGNTFRVIGHLRGEFTGPRWIPRTKASDAGLWCFLWTALESNKRLSKQSWGWWFETPSRLLWRHCNEQTSLDVYSLSGETSCRQISWSLEAARLGVIMIVLLWDLTGISVALLTYYHSDHNVKNVDEILLAIFKFPSQKIHLKISSANCRPCSTLCLQYPPGRSFQIGPCWQQAAAFLRQRRRSPGGYFWLVTRDHWTGCPYLPDHSHQ